MRSYRKELWFNIPKRRGLVNITPDVEACLKGLKEQGCNGPVTEAINKIEKHLNLQAHK